MLRLMRSREQQVSLGLCHGTFDTEQTLREMARAYRMGDLSPGLPSLIVHEPGIRIGHTSVADLSRIRDCVSRHERAAPSVGGFRSVMVAGEQEARIVLEVYSATWHGSEALSPVHDVVRTVEEAESLLSLGSVGSEIDVLRALEGLDCTA